MAEFLNIITFFLSLACTCMSIILTVRFYRTRLPIGRRLSYNVFAEFLAGMVFLIFSGWSCYNMLFHPDGEWNGIDPIIATVLRWAAILPLSVTTLLILRLIKQMEQLNEEENGRR